MRASLALTFSAWCLATVLAVTPSAPEIFENSSYNLTNLSANASPDVQPLRDLLLSASLASDAATSQTIDLPDLQGDWEWTLNVTGVHVPNATTPTDGAYFNDTLPPGASIPDAFVVEVAHGLRWTGDEPLGQTLDEETKLLATLVRFSDSYYYASFLLSLPPELGSRYHGDCGDIFGQACVENLLQQATYGQNPWSGRWGLVLPRIEEVEGCDPALGGSIAYEMLDLSASPERESGEAFAIDTSELMETRNETMLSEAVDGVQVMVFGTARDEADGKEVKARMLCRRPNEPAVPATSSTAAATSSTVPTISNTVEEPTASMSMASQTPGPTSESGAVQTSAFDRWPTGVMGVITALLLI